MTALPETVKELGADVFWGSGLTELVVPENVVMVGDRICYGCSSLRYATINSKVMSMGEGLFENCANLNAVFWNTSATFKHDENPFNLNCLIYICSQFGIGVVALKVNLLRRRRLIPIKAFLKIQHIPMPEEQAELCRIFKLLSLLLQEMIFLRWLITICIYYKMSSRRFGPIPVSK